MAARPSAWRYALRRTIHVLLVERVVDIAGTLAFFSVLSIFPALLAVFGIFGLAGEGRRTADAVVAFADGIAPNDLVAPFRQAIEHLAGLGGAGAGLGTAVGVLVALWTASRYVAAFGGALNRVYGVQEGRSYPKYRLSQLAITIAIVCLAALVLFVLLFSGPVFGPRGIANIGDLAFAVWSVARWAIAAAAMLVIVVLLYWGTPNIRQPRLRWLTAGGSTALVLMAAASAVLVFYVSHFPTFHREYGALAGLAVFLVWLWLMNLMLIFGAGLDVELERVRELRLGEDAMRQIRLPLRDDRRIARLRRRDNALAAQAVRFLPTRYDAADAGQHPVESARDVHVGRHDTSAAADLVDDRRHP
ncbi:YihY/virulence factor BrkB family protein [Gryllotalpicola protaetiae]|uniref:YihY/virulence factor BrkB family protein n=1 Tax=Gryllotalpicola protaetiae TaxID=2419771 RepID=A0A387BP60_9MICO|nr:YihY/virulence factor BrkB family protein [Gryllotalpicola protaetiae]AYG02736.1 YihY/virulence factor BrkB family protein [Gryllotalpicola protaetiae]